MFEYFLTGSVIITGVLGSTALLFKALAAWRLAGAKVIEAKAKLAEAQPEQTERISLPPDFNKRFYEMEREIWEGQGWRKGYSNGSK